MHQLIIELSLPLLLFQQPQHKNLANSIPMLVDSADVHLIKLSLKDYYLHRLHNWYSDSAEEHKDVFILDSLINHSWLPKLPSGRYIPLTLDQLEMAARQNGNPNVVRFAAVYKGPNVRTIILEEIECRLDKKFDKVLYIVDDRDTYKYRYEEGAWKGGSTQTIIYDHPNPKDF